MLPDRSLVLYKGHPAIVEGTTDRVEIILEDGTEVRVRPKDVALLHPGPLSGFGDLSDPPGELAEAWEVLAGENGEPGEPTTLRELAELGFGQFTPATAWAAWLAVADSLYFEGDPEHVVAVARAEVERRRATRAAEAEEKAARARFLAHVKAGSATPEDAPFIRDVEEAALGKSAHSRLLRDLDCPDSPEGAHALLLGLRIWEPGRNPYPERLRVETRLTELPFPAPRQDGERRDLRGMDAFAIDDEGTTTPDDAVSFDGRSLWVHIADPASSLPVGNPIEAEARRRGETLHLPERIVHMLPTSAIELLGLGLQETSPALSFRLEMDAEGSASAAEVVPSTLRIQRLTYEQAEARIAEEPFRSIMQRVRAFREARVSRGAFMLDLPETRIKVGEDGQVHIDPLGRTTSRLMVQECMVMTGQAVARWAAERGLAIPFSVQESSGAVTELQGQQDASGKAKLAPLSQLWAARRTLRRSSRTLAPGKHAGLGVEPYCQATSPLRRYLDLLCHHQIRAVLAARDPLPPEEVTRRIGEVEGVIPALRQAETLSERHWTLVYLLQNRSWSGEAVVMDQRGRNLVVIVPSLALEAELHTRKPVEPDGLLQVKVQEIKLPLLEVHFTVL